MLTASYLPPFFPTTTTDEDNDDDDDDDDEEEESGQRFVPHCFVSPKSLLYLLPIANELYDYCIAQEVKNEERKKKKGGKMGSL